MNPLRELAKIAAVLAAAAAAWWATTRTDGTWFGLWFWR